MEIMSEQAKANPNQKYDEDLQKKIESQVEEKMKALQEEYQKNMDSGDFTQAMKVKQ